MAIGAVFFDIDGTLVDSNEMHVLAWQEAFERAGAIFDRELIHDQIGKGADMLVPALLPGADKAMKDRLAKMHGDIFKTKFLEEVTPFPKARDLLAYVHAAGRTVVLASSASAEELDHYLDLLEARDLVGATTCADDVNNTKPAPDIFATALQKVAPLSKEEVMVIGDTPYDIEAADKCGIAAIALRSGKFSDDQLLKAGPVAIYDDAGALLANIDLSPLGIRRDG